MTALTGWRVLEVADGLAASFCAKVLGDLGAEVVKVEPPGGHASRRCGPRRADAAPDEPGGRFLYLNGGKASVVEFTVRIDSLQKSHEANLLDTIGN